MDIMWAPWRMRYVKYEALKRERGCFLCKALTSEKPEERLVVYRGEDGLVVMNLYPYNTGHLLVAPIRHVPSLEDLSDEEIESLFKLVKRSLSLLRRALKPDGFNVGVNIGRVAGAGLEDHVHVHIVPRWSGDTNFMPVIADTKVIPEALRDTYGTLMKYRDVLYVNSETTT